METVEIKRVSSLEELIQVMPLAVEGFDAMNKRYKAFNLSREEYTKELIWVVGHGPKNGMLVVWVDGEPVGYGVARDNTDRFSGVKQLLLFALYVKPKHSRRCTKPLFEAAEELAKENGYEELVAYNGRFSGAGFRLFEKVFGMKRQMTRFNKAI